MKEFEKKDPPDVSGGYRPGAIGDGCTDPPLVGPIVDYPQMPIVQLPGNWTDGDPSVTDPNKP